MQELFRRRRSLLLILLGLVPFGFVAASVASAYFFVAPAHADVGSPPTDLADSLVDVTFTASDGTELSGWFGSAGDGKQGVILLHGYRGNRTHMTDRARFLMSHGYSVLLYDARGCGESEGDLISIGYHETADLLAAIALMRKSGVERIGLLGVSQGGATVLLASGRLDGIGCIIVESTYDNIENAIDRRFRHYIALPGSVDASLMLPIAERRIGISAAHISPIDSMKSLRAPILVISGEEDTRTTAEDTRRLFESAPEPKELWLIPGADHENLQAFAGEEYTRRVVAFFDRHLAARAMPAVHADATERRRQRRRT
jgi:alpha-beta hydrolase superfamily lysophospholipase